VTDFRFLRTDCYQGNCYARWWGMLGEFRGAPSYMVRDALEAMGIVMALFYYPHTLLSGATQSKMSANMKTIAPNAVQRTHAAKLVP
jgi:hypothetical protein